MNQTQKPQNNIYQKALSQSLTYTEYRKHIDDLFAINKNTGTNHSEAYLNYTSMNIRRMDRLDKKAALQPETIEKTLKLTTPMTWLVLTESWCADAAQSIPYLAKIAEINPNIDLKLILRDEHPDVMDAHLYNGTKSIPKLIILNTTTHDVLGEWGPRPAAAQQIVDQAKADKADSNDGAVKALIDYEKNKALQMWYKKDKGRSVQAEVMDIKSLTRAI